RGMRLMHNYSRNMPPAPPSPPLTRGRLVFLLALGAGLLYLLYLAPVAFLLPCAGIAAIYVYGSIKTRRHFPRLALEREGESTCTFARSFDYRNTDTWILRAVYEELQRGLNTGRYVVPLRATDRLVEDLGFDWEYLDVSSIIPDIAFRTGRTLED